MSPQLGRGLAAGLLVAVACTAPPQGRATPSPTSPPVPSLPPPVVETTGPATSGGWRQLELGGDTTCARGEPYRIWVRRGDPDRLILFFQGGGLCLEGHCRPGDFTQMAGEDRVPRGGMLEPEASPFASATAVFVSYCTGDLHIGDAVRRRPRLGPVRHRGHGNARAALGWVFDRVTAPRSILMAGCSAGAPGAVAHAPAVLARYPEAQVVVVPDSLLLLTAAPLDAEGEWGARLPRGFPEGSAYDGPGAISALARAHPRARVAVVNFARDPTQDQLWRGSGGAGRFEEVLPEALAELERSAPNVRSYTIRGVGHCALNREELATARADGTPLRDWLLALLEGEDVPSVG
jgi:hypothetical protein